jgi:hypothetical protein
MVRSKSAEIARDIAVQQARAVYSIMRSAEIVAKHSTPDVDSGYYYREYKKLREKVGKAVSDLTVLRSDAVKWQTKQARANIGCDIERILQCLR